MNGNRRGQSGILSYFAVVFVFVINWALWLGAFLRDWGEQAVTVNSLTGIEAFLLSNINLFVFIGLLISTFTVLRYNSVL